MIRQFLLACLVALTNLMFSLPVVSAATVGQVDRFDDGTTLDWSVGGGGNNAPTGPINVPGGGPDGDNDAFLSYTTDAVNTGGRFLVLNGLQWSGDYLEAEITGITAQAKNLGQIDLHMRLLLEGPGGAFFSLQSTELPVAGDWQSIFFPISPTALDGGTNLEATLASVNRIRIFHNPDASFPGPFVNASIGLDNIQAIPEPTGATLIAMRVLLIPLCRRRFAFPGISYE